MKEVYFKQIMIADLQNKTARVQPFEKGLNVVTSISSSKDILKMISQMEMLPQIILATIDYSEYDSEIETPANIIVLTEKRKLLNESDYVKNQDTIMAISELLKKQV